MPRSDLIRGIYGVEAEAHYPRTGMLRITFVARRFQVAHAARPGP